MWLRTAVLIGEIGRLIPGYLPGTSIYSQKIEFGNGSSVVALPANPDTARSYEGDVVLDEFAFQQDARKIYEAISGVPIASIFTKQSPKGSGIATASYWMPQ